MMNWKGCIRKWSWPNFKVLSRHSPGVAGKNYDTSVRIVDFWSEMMEAERTPETSVYFNESIYRYTPEGCHLQDIKCIFTREPRRLEPSNMAQILQYGNGTSPNILPKILGVNTQLFLCNT
jgi:hypothetical protein